MMNNNENDFQNTYLRRSHILTMFPAAEYRMFVAAEMAMSVMRVSPGGICSVRDCVLGTGKPVEVRPAELNVRTQRPGFSRMSQTCVKDGMCGRV